MDPCLGLASNELASLDLSDKLAGSSSERRIMDIASNMMVVEASLVGGR